MEGMFASLFVAGECKTNRVLQDAEPIQMLMEIIRRH
jgi:hypothetical protein